MLNTQSGGAATSVESGHLRNAVDFAGATCVATSTAIKYRAFLSSSHCDRRWSKWLYSALKGYRIDKDLAGRKTPAGRVPKSLRPIFRDRGDFAADHSPSEQTLAALEASRFLVVICSPNAAKNKYVNEEIRRFKMWRGDDSV